MKSILLACSLLPTTTAATALAEVMQVPEDYPTIQEAMNEASPGDVIDLAPGIWTDQIVWGLSGVTLRGRNGDGSTVIDGSEQTWSPVVCYGDPSTIEHITFRNGNGSNVFGIVRGGAIYAEYCDVTITDCDFESNRIVLEEFDFTTWGGAIASYGAPMTIERCTFTGNSSEGVGGAIHANYAPLTVRDCKFTDNSAVQTGGGISGEWIDLTIEDCEFRGNEAGWLGGGIHLATSKDQPVGTDSIVTNCRFVRNNASYAGFGMGGGIAIQHIQTVSVHGCSFEDNYGYVAGAIKGGDLPKVGVVNVFDSDFCGNSLPGNDTWGEVIIDEDSVFLTSCQCSVDIDGDGRVGVDDLLRLISSWGGFDPDSDVDNDGTIGVDDLLELIAAWGMTCD